MRVTDQYHLVFRLFTTKLPMMREMGASKSIASLASDAPAVWRLLPRVAPAGGEHGQSAGAREPATPRKHHCPGEMT
jgi:hypothetical protein